MPKETINALQRFSTVHWEPHEGLPDPSPWVGDVNTDGGVPTHDVVIDDVQMSVGWQRGSWVQVSFESDPRYLRMAIDTPDGDNGRTSIYTPPLSRHEINKMIKSLRRARDQAFGADA